MKISSPLAAGLAGTVTVGLLHESLKKITPDAPRMELLDMEALSKVLKNINVDIPGRDDLLRWTVAGEVIGHTSYYGLVAIGDKKGAWLRGLIAGVLAGVTAVTLPKPLGLEGAPGNKSAKTKALTLLLYLAGGLAASAVTRYMTDKTPE